MNLNILGLTAVWLLTAQGIMAAGTGAGTGSAASASEMSCLESIQNTLNTFESAVKEKAEKFEQCMVAEGKVKSVDEVQNLSDADGSFAGLNSESTKTMQDFQNIALSEFTKLQDGLNSALKNLPENLKCLKESLEIVKYAAVPCAGCSDSVYRYVLLLKQFVDEVKKDPAGDFSKDAEFFHEIYGKCMQNLRYAPHAIAFGGVLPSEKAKKEAEEKAKKEAEEKAKKEAEEKAKKEAEEKAKKEAEEKAKKEAEEKAKKEAEEKAKKEAEEKAKKEAEEKAKKEAEEKAKKEAEEKAKKEAEEKAKKEAEEKAKKEAEEKAKKEAEEKAKKEAEEKAKKDAEEKAKKDAEDKAKKDAEDKAKKTSEFIFRRPDIVKLQKEAEEVVGKVGGVKSKTAFYNLRGELNGLEGKKASEVMASLEKHLKNLDKNPEAYEKMVQFANKIIEEMSKK